MIEKFFENKEVILLTKYKNLIKYTKTKYYTLVSNLMIGIRIDNKEFCNLIKKTLILTINFVDNKRVLENPIKYIKIIDGYPFIGKGIKILVNEIKEFRNNCFIIGYKI